MDKTKTTEELAREMFNNGFFCEYCGHIFSEHEVRTLVEGNQNCPHCNKTIT